MSKIKFYQIVMSDNPVSMEYHEISKKSFECVSDIIEIIPFEAITPQSHNFDELQKKIKWELSLTGLEIWGRSETGIEIHDPHTPSERAGMLSHWELLKLRSEVEENFYVIEHDTFLLPEQEENFRELLELREDYELEYANFGLFMGCYSVSKKFAHYAYHLLYNRDFPINGGPYGVMERLYKTYLSRVARKDSKVWNRPVLFMVPWVCCRLLNLGKNEAEMNNTYNFESHIISPDTPEEYYYEVPTTQVISKRLMVTQDHIQYPKDQQEKPWIRHEQFHVID